MPLKQLMINYIKVQLLIYTLNQSEKKKYNERLKALRKMKTFSPFFS